MEAAFSLRARCWVLVAAVTALGGCGSGIPREALALRPRTLEQRQMQARHFPTGDEKMILSASAGLLQDLGYTIDDSETDLGLIVASKEREAVDAGQVIGAVLVSILTGSSVPVDDPQRIRASVVTTPVTGEIVVRVTFQRTVWDNYGDVSRLEAVNDPQLYQEFFDKLSKAVFLTAHEI